MASAAAWLAAVGSAAGVAAWALPPPNSFSPASFIKDIKPMGNPPVSCLSSMFAHGHCRSGRGGRWPAGRAARRGRILAPGGCPGMQRDTAAIVDQLGTTREMPLQGRVSVWPAAAGPAPQAPAGSLGCGGFRAGRQPYLGVIAGNTSPEAARDAPGESQCSAGHVPMFWTDPDALDRSRGCRGRPGSAGRLHPGECAPMNGGPMNAPP